MNTIWILCFAVLIITIPFTTQVSSDQKSESGSGQTASNPSTNSSAVGLGPVSTTLYMLIPAATLGFIHSRS
ncbi:hypothetical protein F2P79_000122 [Pimephales promelas]|nr:hypothetical protein F2P79_000122 [Pimephales promelas]